MDRLPEGRTSCFTTRWTELSRVLNEGNKATDQNRFLRIKNEKVGGIAGIRKVSFLKMRKHLRSPQKNPFRSVSIRPIRAPRFVAASPRETVVVPCHPGFTNPPQHSKPVTPF